MLITVECATGFVIMLIPCLFCSKTNFVSTVAKNVSEGPKEFIEFMKAIKIFF